jgi:hypothetical protein
VKPVEPSVLHEGGVLITFAKDQPPYIPLPASVDAQGTVMVEYELTEEEREQIRGGARLRLWVMYTGVVETPPRPLTPLMLEVVP